MGCLLLFGAPALSAAETALATLQDEWAALGLEQAKLTSEQWEIWRMRNAARLAAFQQKAEAEAAASQAASRSIKPAHLPLPADASPALREILELRFRQMRDEQRSEASAAPSDREKALETCRQRTQARLEQIQQLQQQLTQQ